MSSETCFMFTLIFIHQLIKLISMLYPSTIPSIHIILSFFPRLWIIIDILFINSLIFILIQHCNLLIIFFFIELEIFGILLLGLEHTVLGLLNVLLLLFGLLGRIIDIILATTAGHGYLLWAGICDII
jgi:hypothetical protein